MAVNTRLLTFTLLFVCVAAPSFGAATQIPKMKAVPYEAWAFQIEVPRTARRVSLPATEEVELWELYAYGDFVYIAKVVKVPAGALTSTAIEQDIQAESNLFSKRGPTKRWEMDSKRGDLFKGLSCWARPDEDIPEAAVELGRVLRGRTGYMSAAWTPLKDEASPMLIVGVMGPKGRDNEIESLARFLVRGVTKTKAGASQPSKPTTPPPTAPKPPPAPPSRPSLKKGDIEIVGVVESIAPDKKSLTLMADEVTLFGVNPLKLSTPRRKVVLLDKVPPGVSADARIVVIGRNKGVGVPIRADFLEPTEPSPPPRPN